MSQTEMIILLCVLPLLFAQGSLFFASINKRKEGVTSGSGALSVSLTFHRLLFYIGFVSCYLIEKEAGSPEKIECIRSNF